jgi:Holliday junction resolvase RusA-like endonuclease
VHKGRIRSKEYVAFCGMVDHIVKREKTPQFGAQRLAVTILLHGPNRRVFDLDNRAKAILDSLQRAGVYADDEQIDRLTLVRGDIVKGGLAVVTIEAM